MKSEQEVSKIRKETEEKDLFEYPPAQQTVKNLISNESMRVTILGEEAEPSQKYGRRYSLSKEDFMKQMFGNDQLKPTPISHGKSLYGFAEEMRTLYDKKINPKSELLEENKKLHNLR